MKLRLFSVALLQALCFNMSEAVPIVPTSLAETGPEADTKVTAEVDTGVDTALDALADVDAEAAAKLRTVSMIKN